MKTDDQVIAYADCFAGISGDMFLGALVDAGLEPEYLQAVFAGIDLPELTIKCVRQQNQNITATRIIIETPENETVRTWKDIRLLIEQSSLAKVVKDKALQVFSCLAGAEAAVHGCPVEDVHFHEIGGLDSIVDIIGTIIGIEFFGIRRLIGSPLPLSRGWVRSGHGMLPLPAPAVCEILKDVPVYGMDVALELVTPTGAALIKTLCREIGNYPAMVISRTGYGAGNHKLPGDIPNLFRLVIGSERRVDEEQEVEVIETNLDDWSPECFPYLCERLFAEGALDVTLIPVHMKKGRPGFLLSVIAAPRGSWGIKQCILSETTTIGLRFRRESRVTLPREKGTVETIWGPVLVKRVATPVGISLYPEYEDCCRVARENRVELTAVYGAVNRCTPAEFVKSEE